MSAKIEFMFGEHSASVSASRFRDRYAKCRMALAGSLADEPSIVVELDEPAAVQGNDRVADLRESAAIDAIDTMRGDRLPTTETAAHFMTVFLEAYSAARQLSAG